MTEQLDPDILLAGLDEYDWFGWDSYQARPIREPTIRAAREFMQHLKTGPIPDVAPAPDGSVGFEWVRPDGVVYVDILDRDSHIEVFYRIGTYSQGKMFHGDSQGAAYYTTRCLIRLEQEKNILDRNPQFEHIPDQEHSFHKPQSEKKK